jgi:hypothetical protein
MIRAISTWMCKVSAVTRTRAIWCETARASAVLVDITGQNPNVALQLGLVHALGRPYRVVAQGDPEKANFPSLAKVQIHRYEGAPGFAGLAEAVEELLESAVRARPTR